MKRFAKLFTVRLVYANEGEGGREKGSNDGGWAPSVSLGARGLMRRLSLGVCIGAAGNARQ